MNSYVTFIIPSIDRYSLKHSLESLLNQTDNDWNAVVVFDGVDINKVIDDDRISYVRTDKLGNAGIVRNTQLDKIQSKWIAMLDDDDTLKNTYVESLKEWDNDEWDSIVFSYKTPPEPDLPNGNIIPRPGTKNLEKCNVGMSFAIKSDFVSEYNIRFEAGIMEDYSFLQKCHDFGGRILITNDIQYLTGGMGGWMDKPRITTIINYCTNDYRFIKDCIDNVRRFSTEIIVPVSDCFFDGTPENRELLDKTYKENPGVNFIEYEWNEGNEPRYWHNMSRWIGLQNCSTEWILFLDADEVVESDKFLGWLNYMDKNVDVYEFSTYWYFRNVINRATTLEHAGLLVKKDVIRQEHIFHDSERWGLLYTPYNKKLMENGLDGKPMIHHYSWVRTYEQMLKKVKHWGHTNDKDWTSLVHEEFKKDFDGTDFVHNYNYDKVEGYINEI